MGSNLYVSPDMRIPEIEACLAACGSAAIVQEFTDDGSVEWVVGNDGLWYEVPYFDYARSFTDEEFLDAVDHEPASPIRRDELLKGMQFSATSPILKFDLDLT